MVTTAATAATAATAPTATTARTTAVELGFAPEALLERGEQSVGVLLGLDADNLGGLLAKGDLCR